MTDRLTFDFDAVTTRMLLDFKRETGLSLMALADDDGNFELAELPEEAIAGVIWLALRMNGQPDATFDDALDVPLTALTGGADDPDEAAGTDPTNAG